MHGATSWLERDAAWQVWGIPARHAEARRATLEERALSDFIPTVTASTVPPVAG